MSEESEEIHQGKFPGIDPQVPNPLDVFHVLTTESGESLSPNEEICAWYGVLKYLLSTGYEGLIGQEAVVIAHETRAFADAALLGASNGITTHSLEKAKEMLSGIPTDVGHTITTQLEDARASILLADSHLRTFTVYPSAEGLPLYTPVNAEDIIAQAIDIQFKKHNNTALFDNIHLELEQKIDALDPHDDYFRDKIKTLWEIAVSAELHGIHGASSLVDRLIDKLLNTNDESFTNILAEQKVLSTLFSIGEIAIRQSEVDRVLVITNAIERIIDKEHNLGGFGYVNYLMVPEVYIRLARLYYYLDKPDIATQKIAFGQKSFEHGLSTKPGRMDSDRAVSFLQFIEDNVFQQPSVDTPSNMSVILSHAELETTTRKLALINAINQLLSNFEQFHDPFGHERLDNADFEAIKVKKIRVYAKAGVLLLKLAHYTSGEESARIVDDAFKALAQAAEASFSNGIISSNEVAKPFYDEFLIPLIDAVKENNYSWATVFSRLQFDKLPHPIQDMIKAAYEIKANHNDDQGQRLLQSAGKMIADEMQEAINRGNGHGSSYRSSPTIIVWGKIASNLLANRAS